MIGAQPSMMFHPVHWSMHFNARILSHPPTISLGTRHSHATLKTVSERAPKQVEESASFRTIQYTSRYSELLHFLAISLVEQSPASGQEVCLEAKNVQLLFL